LQPSTTSHIAFAQEWAALEAARAWPPDLRVTVPAPIVRRRIGGHDVIVMDGLPGRSVYVDLHRILGLAPPRVERLLMAASNWLAGFHLATRQSTATPPCALPHAAAGASHGDFWPRNILVDRSGSVTGVVDWEAFVLDGCPLDDLFQFALSCAMVRARTVKSCKEAFHRGFLENTVLARAIRRSFLDYCARTGVPAEALRPAFERFLARGAEAGPPVEATGAGSAKADTVETWLTWRHQLRMADRSVFSG
jgi:hypothetical protein